MIKILKFGIFCLFIGSLFASENKISEVKKKIKSIQNEITQLQKDLDEKKVKVTSANQHLDDLNTEIKHIQEQKEKIEEKITTNEAEINQINTKINSLLEDKKNQTDLLANFIKIQYKMNKISTFGQLTQQEDSHQLNQKINYYSYILQAYQKKILALKLLEEALSIEQLKYIKEKDEEDLLKEKLFNQLTNLANLRERQHSLIKELIKNSDKVEESLKNRQAQEHLLNDLLKKLSFEHLNSNATDFDQQKLPYPVEVNKEFITSVNNGIFFKAPIGREVKAVYNGKIVFNEWLKGYGFLTIVNHGKGYMTLYAHNDVLLKQKGDWVHKGENIAKIGHSGAFHENGLYFEIRHRGKAISPLEWMS